ncbi:MAG: DUF255 domain-containing protein [Algisphaera sp.]
MPNETAASHAHTNALIDETSPYLLQHAHNPVDWQPWGPKAFAEAQRRQVPILLSVGYATCYWCHVMEREVFEKEALVGPLNEHFVCIKVDREERPDVDDIYMTATQVLAGSGGWPMNVFLTPPKPTTPGAEGVAGIEGDAAQGYGLKPFWAGTYIPPTPMHGRPSFPQVVDGMHEAWTKEREQVLTQAAKVAQAVQSQSNVGAAHGPLDVEMVDVTVGALRGAFDAQHGGFSGPAGPKFPTPAVPGLLLAAAAPAGATAKEIRLTLDAMARGGMYDQVGGGFHRYSVDEKWLVPHFEKMLYDNGQLLSLYAEAYERWQGKRFSALYARVLHETSAYLLRDMRDDTGAFWSAQDAEVNAREGQNYLWTPDQITAALAEEPDAARLTEWALKMYGLEGGTNFQDPHHADEPASNVLYLPLAMSKLVKVMGLAQGQAGTLNDARNQINAALLKVRNTRDQPITDNKVLAAWNGLAIAGLADAGRVLDEPRYVDAAVEAADAILKNMRDDAGGLLRTMRDGQARVPAFLEDYAFMAAGLLALDRVRPRERRFYDTAVELMALAEQKFGMPNGGWFDTLADQTDLFVRSQGTYDGAMPSGNAQMIHNLLTMRERTKDTAAGERAVVALRSMAGSLRERGRGMAHGMRALGRALAQPDLAAALEAGDVSKSGGDAQTIMKEPMSFMAPQASSAPVMAQAKQQADGSVKVTLKIAPGYHLNANPASAPELMATTLTVRGDGVLDVTYPAGHDVTYPFSPEPLGVYDGTVELHVAKLPEGVDSLTLTYQACTDSACLAPRSVELGVE